jgi:hypothetical protein
MQEEENLFFVGVQRLDHDAGHAAERGITIADLARLRRGTLPVIENDPQQIERYFVVLAQLGDPLRVDFPQQIGWLDAGHQSSPLYCLCRQRLGAPLLDPKA